MSAQEKTARITAIEAPHMRKKARESFKETRATMMRMISAITDITEIVLAFLSSISNYFIVLVGCFFFFGEGVSESQKGLSLWLQLGILTREGLRNEDVSLVFFGSGC